MATPCENPQKTSRSIGRPAATCDTASSTYAMLSRDQQLAILTRHPARDGDLGPATIETVQRLDRHGRPRAADGKGAELSIISSAFWA